MEISIQSVVILAKPSQTMSNEKEQSQTQEIRDVNYQYFMVNECAEGLPIYSLDRSGVLTCVPFYLFFSFVLHKPEQSASDLEDMKQVIDYLNSNLSEQRVRILNL